MRAARQPFRTREQSRAPLESPFRAPSNGYSLIQVDSNPKSTFLLRDLAAAWRQGERCKCPTTKSKERLAPPRSHAHLGRRKKQKGMCLADRPCREPNAAGIDIGAREVFVAVPPDRDEFPVRVFDTFTEDLQAMTRWLKACGIITVAMESTVVYFALSSALIGRVQVLRRSDEERCIQKRR